MFEQLTQDSSNILTGRLLHLHGAMYRTNLRQKQTALFYVSVINQSQLF